MYASLHNKQSGCFLMLQYASRLWHWHDKCDVWKCWHRPESKASPEGLSNAGTDTHRADVSGFLRELSKCGLIYGLSRMSPAFSSVEVPACRRWCCMAWAGSGRQGKWWRRTDSAAAGGFAVHGCRSTPVWEKKMAFLMLNQCITKSKSKNNSLSRSLQRSYRYLVHPKMKICLLSGNTRSGWVKMAYSDVFISCLNSHSDGTHALQRIIGEQVIKWSISQNLCWWGNKLIYILDGLRATTFSANCHLGWMIPLNVVTDWTDTKLTFKMAS